MLSYIKGKIFCLLQKKKKVSFTNKREYVTKKSKGYFNIYKDKSKYKFKLVSKNGNKILVSRGYKNIDYCKKGIRILTNICQDINLYKLCESKDGKYYFVIKIKNYPLISPFYEYKPAIHQYKDLVVKEIKNINKYNSRRSNTK